jgi:hypothetical protein
MFPAKFGSILPSSFRGEDFFKQYSEANQKQELPLVAIFVGGTAFQNCVRQPHPPFKMAAVF